MDKHELALSVTRSATAIACAGMRILQPRIVHSANKVLDVLDILWRAQPDNIEQLLRKMIADCEEMLSDMAMHEIKANGEISLN